MGDVRHALSVLAVSGIPAEVRRQADTMQAASEAAARARGEDARYTGILAAQQEGPLRRFVVPNDSNRKSRSPLFDMYIVDTDAVRACCIK